MEKPFDSPINVTQPFLPPLSEFCEGLEEIWNNKWITNDGPVLKRFTKALSKLHKTDNVCLFSNGTLALQIGLQGMEISGEVITTPFTFVATTHALFWNKVRPVFCDIEPDYYTLDPAKVEAAITPWTSAILAVHVFGNPCQLEELQSIAKKHKLKLIYDAAHAFGTEVNDLPISSYGDLSVFSFHATKAFHSIEGGMLTFHESGFSSVFDYLKNFGFKNQTEVVMPGTNAKMNELQALMGLKMLDYMDDIVEKRRLISDVYRERLRSIRGVKIPPLPLGNVKYNYVYFPIEIDEQEFGVSRDAFVERLKDYNVFARRYFYPLVCDFSCYQSLPIHDDLTIARGVASRIMNLPIYADLDIDDVQRICNIIIEIQLQAGL